MLMTDTDLYALLDVPRNVAQGDLKSAFRKAARIHHPDLNPDDASAQERFIEIATAFDILNDPSKRALYDEFGLDAFTQGFDLYMARRQREEEQRTIHTSNTSHSSRKRRRFDPSHIPGFGHIFTDTFKEYEDVFKDMLQQDLYVARGPDAYASLSITLAKSLKGGIVSFLHRDDALAVRIPAGVKDGEEILVEGEGDLPKEGQGAPGDLRLTIHIEHPEYMERHGLDLSLKLPISMTEALLGAKIPIPTPHGECLMTLPEGVHSGAKLRLKHMGLHDHDERGDFYIIIEIRSPDFIDAEIRRAAATLERGYQKPLRDHIEW